jgi:hypothetical protein
MNKLRLVIYNNFHDGQDNRNKYNIDITQKNIYTSNDLFDNISVVTDNYISVFKEKPNLQMKYILQHFFIFSYFFYMTKENRIYSELGRNSLYTVVKSCGSQQI